MKNLLLLSASSYKDTGYLVHCKDWVEEFYSVLNDDEILYIPYASVTKSYDEVEKRVKDFFDLNIKSIHHYENPIKAVQNAKAFMVNGGNTFKLINEIYKNKIFDALKQSCQNGALYFGWSAGSNIAGINIQTTNDMPIVYPSSFDALNLIDYDINPHFISGKIPGHNGESREQRLNEFMIENKNIKILALPEGSGLLVKDDKILVVGFGEILQMQFDKATKKTAPGFYIE